MEANGKCEECRFWQAREPGIGICRRFPPHGRQGDASPLWVRTKSADWCGEFSEPTVAVEVPVMLRFDPSAPALPDDPPKRRGRPPKVRTE